MPATSTNSVSPLRDVRRRPRLLALLVPLLLLATFGCQQLAVQKIMPAPASGAELFQAKCTTCHDLARALNQYRSEEVWFATITRMKEAHHAELSREEITQLANYHVERQRQEAALFQEKCQKCHPGKVFLEQNLTADQARAIIKRMQLQAGNTIGDADVEIIVRYHTQAQQAALTDNLRGIYRQVLGAQPELKRGVVLFLEKCSTCHQPDRALAVIKDPQVWALTIKRMQSYSKGAITDRDAQDLVEFHVSEQQREIATFKETCTKCHDDERITSRSMSEEQWLATIKRMREKAPELITDEKVNLLAAYFHRRELALARIFSDKCRLCHDKKAEASAGPSVTSAPLEGLITLANAEFGGSLQVQDVKYLLSPHVERQKRAMRLYEQNCSTCHPEGVPKKRAAGAAAPGERTREQWISFIAVLQGEELDKGVQNTINSQIDYHLSRF